jgi:hypothetical protein
MDHTVTVVLEFNCYEPYTNGEITNGEMPMSVWLYPYSVKKNPQKVNDEKPNATKILGPVAVKLAEDVANSLANALTGLGITVEREVFADD